jgi:hypothetical protein
MANEIASINIPKEVLASIVEAHIQSAIIVALDADKENLIPKMVEAAIKQKVDGDGNINKDSYYNKYSFVETIVNKTIQNCAREALLEWVEQSKPLIKQSIVQALQKDKNAIVKAFMEGLEGSLKSNYSFHCNVDFQSKK